MADMKFFIPITKVDLERREVWGVAAEERADKMDEIFDYESSRPFFEEWSREIEKASGGKSKFNLRSMHQPVAAGKGVALHFDDAAKTIPVGAKVVDDAEWRKVAEGVYSGFSIGGDYVRRWQDPANPALTRYTARPVEISLVDNPAMFGATFEVIKADGSTEMRKFAALNKADDAADDKPVESDSDKSSETEESESDAQPQADAPTDEKEKDADEKTDASKSTLAQNLAKLAKCYPEYAVAYDAENWDVTRGLQVLAQVTALMQSEGWAGEPAHVALLATILSQLQAFLSGELTEVQNQAAVNAETQAAVAETYMAQSQTDDVSDDALAETETETMEMSARARELAKAAPNGANARVILESKIHQAYTVTCDQLLQRGYIDRDTRLKISGLMGELLTKFADALGPELEKVTLSPGDVDFIAAKLAAGEMQKLVKVGARHNAGDAAMLQTIHDHACALGAACVSADKDADKAMQPDALKKMIDDAIAPLAKTDELQKALRMIDQSETATGDLQKRAEDLEKQVKQLDAQVQLLKRQPEAQLPVLRVAKRDGTPETAAAEAQTQAEKAALEKALKHPDLSPSARAEIGRVLALDEMKKTYQQGPQKLG